MWRRFFTSSCKPFYVPWCSVTCSNLIHVMCLPEVGSVTQPDVVNITTPNNMSLRPCLSLVPRDPAELPHRQTLIHHTWLQTKWRLGSETETQVCCLLCERLPKEANKTDNTKEKMSRTIRFQKLDARWHSATQALFENKTFNIICQCFWYPRERLKENQHIKASS